MTDLPLRPLSESAATSPPRMASELRALLALAMPMALSQWGIMLPNLIDTAMVGQVDPTANAGLSIGRNVSWAVSSFAQGVAMAVDPLSSQAVGAGEPGRAHRAWVRGVWASGMTGLVSLLLGFVALEAALPRLGVAPDVTHAALTYYGYAIPAQVMWSLFVATRSYLQASGRTVVIVAATVLYNLVNLSSAWTMVITFKLGAMGAALAADIGSVALLFPVFLLALRSAKPLGDARDVRFKDLWTIGLPAGTMLFAEMGVFTVGGLLAAHLGKVEVNAHQVVLGLASFTFMGALGVSGATSARVGNAVGEGRSPRAIAHLGLVVGVGVMLVGGALFLLLPRALAGVFTRDDQTLALAASLMIYPALFACFDAVQVVAAGALRGMGDVRLPMLINVVGHWLFTLPCAAYFALGLGRGVTGLWQGLSLGLALVAGLLYWRLHTVSGRRIARL